MTTESSSDPLPPVTVGDLLHRAARRDPGGVALIDAGQPDRRWTWAELEGDAVATARRLAASHPPGAVLAIWAPSEPAWVVLELGAALAGVVVQPLDPTLELPAVVAALRRTGAVTLAAARSHLAKARALLGPQADLPALRSVIPLGPLPPGPESPARDNWTLSSLSVVGRRKVTTVSVPPPAAGGSRTSRMATRRGVESRAGSDADARPGPLAPRLPTVTPTMGALLLPTSGTTGNPKAALLSHRAVTADARLVAARMGLHPGDTWLTTMPVHRSGGCATTVIGCLAAGATMICSPRTAAGDVLALAGATRPTVLSAFPRALHDLVDRVRRHALAREGPFRRLRLVQTGGAPVSPALVHAVAQALGARLSVVYGLTEAAPVLTQTDQRDPSDDPAASVGRPLPGTELAVADPVTGVSVPTGAVGLVVARGPQIMDGYVGDPAATARALDAEGWLHTGDLGWLDEHGRLHVEGRLDDVIQRDGDRWLPGPVERVLTELPGVAEAVVVAAAGDTPRPEVVAFVRARPGHHLDADELRAAVGEARAGGHGPDRVVVVDDLPALPSGKVRRFVLRQWAAAAS